jgi:hypothetical protein
VLVAALNQIDGFVAHTPPSSFYVFARCTGASR